MKTFSRTWRHFRGDGVAESGPFMKTREVGKARSSFEYRRLGCPFRAGSSFVCPSPGCCLGRELSRPVGVRHPLQKSCQKVAKLLYRYLPVVGFTAEIYQRWGWVVKKSILKNRGMRRSILSGNSGGKEVGKIDEIDGISFGIG